MKKILYLTVPSYFDLEISLIRELSKICDITVLMIVSPESLQSSAFNIERTLPFPKVVSSLNMPGMSKYAGLIDLNIWNIANNPDNSILNCIKLSKQIIKFIKNNNFDLIHCTSRCKTTLFLLPFIYKFPNKLLTVHDPIPHHKVSFLHNLFRIRLYYKIFRNLLFLSPSLTKGFREIYKYKKLVIYYSALGPYDFLQSYSKELPNYDNYILFFGRIQPYKGVDLLIKGFERSKYCRNGFKLVIAGKGNLDDANNSNVIILNRYIDNRELANLIQHCQFVVLPYRSATQSGCVMSAYAFNKPVLATNVGDFPLTVEDGYSGIIISPNNVDAITEGLDRMKTMDILQMSNNIKEKFFGRGRESWTKIAENLLHTYTSIINDKGKHPTTI